MPSKKNYMDFVEKAGDALTATKFGAMLDLDTMGGSPMTPFLSGVAPGLVGAAGSAFSSKELNVGRGAVTGGRAYRHARTRSAEGPGQVPATMADSKYPEVIGQPVGPVSAVAGDGGRGEHDYGSGRGYTKEELAEAQAMHSGGGSTTDQYGGQHAGMSGIGGHIAGQVGMGIGTSMAQTALLGRLGGFGWSDIGKAMPGAVASGALSPMTGSLPARAIQGIVGGPLGVALGAANEIGGWAGGMHAADVGIDRARTAYDGHVSDLDAFGEYGDEANVRGAAEMAGLNQFGAIGLAGQALAGSLGYGETPYGEAERAAVQQAEQNFLGSGMVPGVYSDAQMAEQTLGDKAKGMLGDAVSAAGSGIASGMEAVGGYGSKEAAEEAGFTYNTGATGQISIDPPSMNIGGLDQKLGYSSKTQRQISQVESKLGDLTPAEEAIAAKYSKTKKAVSKIQKARRQGKEGFGTSVGAALGGGSYHDASGGHSDVGRGYGSGGSGAGAQGVGGSAEGQATDQY
jgi:hypothetical protein